MAEAAATFTISEILAADGSVVATARQTMIVSAGGVPLGADRWMAAPR